jgi:hypothetical protein
VNARDIYALTNSLRAMVDELDSAAEAGDVVQVAEFALEVRAIAEAIRSHAYGAPT